MRSHLITSLAAAAALATGAAAAPAHADSVVYVKQGNLFLTSPDGAKGYQLTFDGDYSSPSQADNGTIGALHGKQIVRMDRSGKLLNAPIDAMGSDRPANIAGPYEARISPDGTRFAYWFYVQSSYTDYANNIEWIDTGSYGTWTYADHFTGPNESEFNRTFVQPEWVADDRLVGTHGFWMNMWTWQLGTGHGYTSSAEQFWFGLHGEYDPQWDVTPAVWYDDPALSADQAKLAMTGSAQEGVDTTLYIAQTHGSAWVGTAPYVNDYLNGTTPAGTPEIRCHVDAGGNVTNPSWSSDSSTVAFGAPNGVYAMPVPDSFDCAQMNAHLIAAGGTDPAFGRADVTMAQAPTPPTADPGPNPGPNPNPGPKVDAKRIVVSRLSLRPKAFRVAHRAAKAAGTRVSFTLSAPGPVTLTPTKHGKRIAGSVTATGKAGANTVAFSGRLNGRTLTPGSYRLTVSVVAPKGATATPATTTFTVLR